MDAARVGAGSLARLVKEPQHSVPSLAGRSAMTLRHELAALGLL